MNKADNYGTLIFPDAAFNSDGNSIELEELGLLGIASYTNALTENHLKDKIKAEGRTIIFNKLLNSIR